MTPPASSRLLAAAIPLCVLPFAGCERHESAATESGDVPADPGAAAETVENTAATDWPQSRGGPGLQGRVPGPVPKQPEIDWTFTLDSPIEAEAAVSGDTLVIGDIMGFVYALDLEARELRWKIETDDSIEGAPLIHDGRVFIGSSDGTFRALDLADGSEAWSITGDDKFSSGANLIPGPDGPRLVVNGYDGTTRCLDPADGAVIWTHPTRDFIDGTPALLESGRLAFGGCDALIHLLDAATGEPVQQIATEAQITNSVTTYGDQIFAANYANQVVAAQLGEDEPLWIYQSADFPFFSAPAVDDRHVYIGCRDKSLHAIDRESGDPAWTFATGARVESSPIVFDDAVVFGSSDGRLYAVSPNSGELVWRLDLGENLTAPPVYARDRLIIGGNRGTLFLIQ